MNFMTTFSNSMKLFYFVAILIIVSACSKSFVVQSDIPKPLVEKSGLSAYIKYSDEFLNYKYMDSSKDRALEEVEFGGAQTQLFDRVFSSLFELVDEGGSPDLIIEPHVIEFQYSIPAETKSTQYEAWLKYRLKITSGSDEEIADWVVKGYGKKPKSIMISHLKLFNAACNIALRDVGAQLAIGFRTQPSIKEFIINHGAEKHTTKSADAESEEKNSVVNALRPIIEQAAVAQAEEANSPAKNIEIEQPSETPEEDAL